MTSDGIKPVEAPVFTLLSVSGNEEVDSVQVVRYNTDVDLTSLFVGLAPPSNDSSVVLLPGSQCSVVRCPT